MSCRLKPVGLVVAAQVVPNGLTVVKWTLETKPPRRDGWVHAEPFPEGYLISQLRAEWMVAVSTWQRKMLEWEQLHPELQAAR